ncbi:MAG: pentapeptide repeat-containing protein [Gammaproteobacteria bacterium]|nr:pentapeptide repeat-containing protein [Gammaproteobacteria bacterium]
MPDTNQVLNNKLQIYRKVIVQEFIREFTFLLDVVAGRASAKGDFTDKLIAIVKFGTSNLLGNISIPGVNVLDSIIEIGIEALNDKRKERSLDHLDQQATEIDNEQLRILLECVALEASRRYEFILDTYLSDSPFEVVPLAKTQVERMLEYVIRTSLPLTYDNLLTGIIAGRSGAYVTGFTNTRLESKDDPKLKFTADGLCGRPAFMTANKQFYILNPETSQPLHKRQSNPNMVTTLTQKFDYKKESLFNYGYTKFIKKKKTIRGQPIILEPKYGYVLVPLSVVQQFGYEVQPRSSLSSPLTTKIDQHNPTIQVVTRREIEEYLQRHKTKMSFNDFIRRRTPNTTFTLFEPNQQQDLDFSKFDFSNADFSDCILNGIIIKGSLENSKFQESYLIGADLSGVTNANHTNFMGAHLEYLKGNNANLNGANLTQAQLHYANLQESQLRRIQHLGAIWINANLKDASTDDLSEIEHEQQEQQNALKVQLEEMLTEIKDQREIIAEIQLLYTKQEQYIQTSKDMTDTQTEQAKKLQSLLGKLVQEKQSRMTFERYCRAEFNQLKTYTQDISKDVSSHQQAIQQLDQRVHQLELLLKEQGALLQMMLNIIKPNEAQELLKKYCPTLFIEQQQQAIRDLKQKIQDQLDESTSSPEEQQQLSEIINQAKNLTDKLTQTNFDEKEFSEDLDSLTNEAHRYIDNQTNKLNETYHHLQKLDSCIKQLKQNDTREKSIPELQPPISDNNNVQPRAAEKQVLTKFFHSTATPEISPKSSLLLSAELSNALKWGKFEITLLQSNEKGLLICYKQTDLTKTNYSKTALNGLRENLYSNKADLITGDTSTEDTLIIKSQYSSDVQDLKEYLEENAIILKNVDYALQ